MTVTLQDVLERCREAVAQNDPPGIPPLGERDLTKDERLAGVYRALTDVQMYDDMLSWELVAYHVLGGLQAAMTAAELRVTSGAPE